MSNPTAVQKKLKKLIDEGLVFSDCVAAFGVNKLTTPVVQQAAEMYASDDLEIDPETVLSQAEDGTWVMAWVLVPNDEDKE